MLVIRKANCIICIQALVFVIFVYFIPRISISSNEPFPDALLLAHILATKGASSEG